MAVRRAENANDITRMIELGAKMHHESVYSKYDYDKKYLQHYGEHMLKHPEEYGLFLAEDGDGEITAMVAGFISPLYFNPEVKVAHDFFLYVHPQMRGGLSAVKLMRAYEKWAKQAGASEVSMGITAGIANETAAKFFGGIGYESKGSYLNKEV